MKTISSMILGMAIAASAVLAADQPAARRVEVGDLVCEWFAHMAVGGPPSEYRMSGWDVEPPGPNPFAHAYYSWFKLVAKDDEAPVTIGRRFPVQQDGVLTWEFVFRLPQLTNGPFFQIMSGDQAVLRLRVADGALMAEAGEGAPRRLAGLQADRDCGVSVRLDLDAHRADIRVDGRMAATAVPLPDKALDRLAITTGNSFVGDLFVAPVLLHRGYALRESFISVPEGALPEGWTSTPAGGKVAIRPHAGAAHPANSRALCLERTQAGALDATVAFPPVKSAVEVEAKVWLPDGGNGASIAWLDAAGRPVVTLAARDGALSASGAGGAPVPLWAGLRKTVWYNLRVVIDPAAKSATCYVNDIERGRVAIAVGAQVAQMRVTAPEAVGGQCWADELVVRPHLPYPADYAPEPVPVSTGSNIVMMQSCDLWREGLHCGWDYIRDFPERRPLLGYYNGGDPEVEDWTIGWLLRNGISCDFKCWYQGPPGPIHATRHGEGLIGFKRARWSNKMKFAINITFPIASLDDWRDNVVPYLIEHLFRDPRYLTIDNKPFLAIWVDNNAAVAVLREECRKAGFDGCWVIVQEIYGRRSVYGPSKDFDATCAYGCAAISGEQQKKYLESERAKSKLDTIPTLGIGVNAAPWRQNFGELWLKADEFRDLCEWARTTYMPAGASNALSRRVVKLSTWNEWGEGHSMMPAAGWGFGYLHAVRDTFGQPPFPPDVEPTPAQVARLTTLYPRGEGYEEKVGPPRMFEPAAGKESAVAVRAIKPEADLAAYWKLNDIAGQTVPDSSGNGHDGTLQWDKQADVAAMWVAAVVQPAKGAYLLCRKRNLLVSNSGILFSNITDNFTMTLWAKPLLGERVAAKEAIRGDDGMKGQRYAIWPTYGGVYGEGHAGAGISIGGNGISVYEHGGGYMPALLVHDVALTGWNHVAVVYENKQPKLYVNGVLVKTGLTSTMIVHPSFTLGGGGYGYFHGRLGEVRIYSRVLTLAEIEKLAKEAK